MSDGGVQTSWKNTLYRYIWGPGLALVLMVIATIAALGIDPRIWREDGTVFQTDPEGTDWQSFTPERFAALHAEQNATLLVHIVATWAEGSVESRMALCASPTVAERVARGDLKLLLADHSQRPLATSSLLASLGDPPLPAVIIYPPGKRKPIIRQGPLMEGQIKEVIGAIDH